MLSNSKTSKFFRLFDSSKEIETYMYILIFSSKDVRLPQNLQRAMAAEAEAAREARAKVYILKVE